MRKIKLTLKCRVPSWNFCNLDGPTADGRYSKELCRFCVSTRQGKYCMLHEEWLTSDHTFTHKTKDCIDATAGFAITTDEPTPQPAPKVDPKLIIRETLKTYKETVSSLVAQGYPRQMAEKIAEQFTIGEQR